MDCLLYTSGFKSEAVMPDGVKCFSDVEKRYDGWVTVVRVGLLLDGAYHPDQLVIDVVSRAKTSLRTR